MTETDILTLSKFPKYLATKDGRILTIQKGKLVCKRQRKNSRGYFMVSLYNKGKRSDLLVHRLIKQAYDPCKIEGARVFHIDKNKTNNQLNNLQWKIPNSSIMKK